MTAAEQKLRLTLTILDPHHDLEQTLALLQAKGIATERIGIITAVTRFSPASMPALRTRATRSSTLPIATSLVPLIGSARDVTIMASPILPRLWNDGWKIPAIWRNTRQTAANPELATELCGLVRQGSVLLSIEALDQADQWCAARILLKESETAVMALEYSPRSSA